MRPSGQNPPRQNPLRQNPLRQNPLRQRPPGQAKAWRSGPGFAGSVAVMIALMLMANVAVGFGDRGHRIVAQIALGELSADAKQALSRLLRDRTLADLASEPDRWRRDRPETGPWHYVNLPPDATGYDSARDERGADGAAFPGNVVERIGHFRSVLANPETSDKDALNAVIWLTHLVGDVHQPLHVGLAKDRGGNDIRVEIDVAQAESGPARGGRPDEGTRLHRIWDSTLLDRPGVSWEEHARDLARDISDEERASWRVGGEARWAGESWALANNLAYRDARGRWLQDGDSVGRRYLLTRSVVVEDQLRKAGVRLAAVLEDALR